MLAGLHRLNDLHMHLRVDLCDFGLRFWCHGSVLRALGQLHERFAVEAIQQDGAELGYLRIARIGACALIIEGIHSHRVELGHEFVFFDAGPSNR